MSGKRFRPEREGWKPAQCETGSLIDQLNYNVYMDGQHKYLFDDENLVKVLQICGFTEVSKEILIIKEICQQESLNQYILLHSK